LATIAAALVPWLTDADLAEKVATSAVYLAIGISIGSLLSGVARSAVRGPV
jgi:ABC-type nitrate/sulfonate/bicarbonate transport system permease component